MKVIVDYLGLSNTCCASVLELHRNTVSNAKDSELEFTSLSLPSVPRDKLALKIDLLKKFLATFKVSSGM